MTFKESDNMLYYENNQNGNSSIVQCFSEDVLVNSQMNRLIDAFFN